MGETMTDFVSKVSRLYWLMKTQVVYRLFFGKVGTRTVIFSPLQLRNARNVFIGRSVTINRHVWLLTLQINGMGNPRMILGDGCEIGHFNHITCVNYVEIGRKVLTADRVHISDNGHGYKSPEVAIVDQPILSKGPVIIGEGTWIGENANVLSCRIGRNCVIGANAVVTRDIPDFSVAVGVPARVVKRLDLVSGVWVSI